MSQIYIKIFENDEYYDITIKVGKDPNVKIFHAHMIILRHHSPYLYELWLLTMMVSYPLSYHISYQKSFKLFYFKVSYK